MRYPALGIDVAQATLAVALTNAEGAWQHGSFRNDSEGFHQLQRWVKRQVKAPVWVCLEATGRYSDAIAHFLHAEPWVAQVSILNPSQSHAYARSQMRRSKTDKADAQLLAHFAATQSPDGWTPPTPSQQALQELMRHRDNLMEMRQQTRNRLKAGVRNRAVQRQLQEQEALLTRQITEVEQEAQQLMRQEAHLWHQYLLLCSIPGVGPILATHFLAEVPDITRFEDAGQLAAYAGLVPTQHDSGSSVKRQGKLAKTGNVHLRTAFYMPALSAARYNPLIAVFATRLQAAGKAKMTIVAAVMHKLLRLAYGVLKSNRPFDPTFTKQPQLAT